MKKKLACRILNKHHIIKTSPVHIRTLSPLHQFGSSNKGLKTWKMHIIITMDGIMHQQDVGNSKGNVSFLLRLYMYFI